MSDPAATTTVQPVRKSVRVGVPPERAFAAFAEEMRAWWPMDTHHIAEKDAVDVIIEPRAGGRWFERAADGAECDWGHVIAYEPPGRLVLGWQLDADWAYDPSLVTTVELRFTPDGAGTLVELEHRDLERFGDRQRELRDAFESEGGWSGLLERFAGHTAG